MTFKQRLIDYVIGELLVNFLNSLDKEHIKIQLDNLIDSLEFQIEASPNRYDDSLLPIIRFTRELFDIPDLPDER